MPRPAPCHVLCYFFSVRVTFCLQGTCTAEMIMGVLPSHHVDSFGSVPSFPMFLQVFVLEKLYSCGFGGVSFKRLFLGFFFRDWSQHEHSLSA